MEQTEIDNQNKIRENWLENVEIKGKDLTEWEDNFIKSLRLNRSRNYTYVINDIPGFFFTIRQAEVLERIYISKTS